MFENGSCQIAEGMFDKDALIFDDGQITKAGIALPDGTPYVEISCEGFRILASGQPEMHHLYALEPWMGRCDNTGYDKELSQKPNINVLEPEGIFFDKSYVISVR